MHSSTIIATLFAALAIASPVHQQLHKKAYVWDVVTEIVTVTVTAGQEPETVRILKTVVVEPEVKTTTTKSRTRSRTRPTTTTTTTTTTPPPPPPTTTTTTPPPPPPTTEAPPPPTTTEAPPPPATTEAPAPVVVESQAPEPTTAAAPVQAPSSSTGDGVKDAALNKHNEYRAKHHVGSVSWDDSLASSAAALAGGCTNKHGLIVGGQNIAAKGVSGGGDPVQFMSDAVDSWYNEVNQFGPYYGQANVGDSSVLHFTQVVWKATTRIGCAVHECGTQGNIFPGFNSWTIVCNYQAAGNFGGEYANNVLPP